MQKRMLYKFFIILLNLIEFLALKYLILLIYLALKCLILLNYLLKKINELYLLEYCVFNYK